MLILTFLYTFATFDMNLLLRNDFRSVLETLGWYDVGIQMGN